MIEEKLEKCFDRIAAVAANGSEEKMEEIDGDSGLGPLERKFGNAEIIVFAFAFATKPVFNNKY